MRPPQNGSIQHDLVFLNPEITDMLNEKIHFAAALLDPDRDVTVHGQPKSGGSGNVTQRQQTEAIFWRGYLHLSA